MTHEQVIKLLTEQNERLLTILEKFAEKDINIVVNSYNGAYGDSSVDNAPTSINGRVEGLCSIGDKNTSNTNKVENTAVTKKPILRD